LPEDIVLITAGMLGVIDGHSWIKVSVFMYLGVLAGDSAIFYAGRHFGARLLKAAWFQRFLPPSKQVRVVEFYAKHGAKGLFIGRFLPGLRAPIFFSAGSLNVSYLKFLFFDGLAAIISVPVFVWLGHWLWSTLQGDSEILEGAMALARACYGWVFVAILLIVGFGWWRARRPVSLAGR
jgi:hypothetical protein